MSIIAVLLLLALVVAVGAAIYAYANSGKSKFDLLHTKLDARFDGLKDQLGLVHAVALANVGYVPPQAGPLPAAALDLVPLKPAAIVPLKPATISQETPALVPATPAPAPAAAPTQPAPAAPIIFDPAVYPDAGDRVQAMKDLVAKIGWQAAARIRTPDGHEVDRYGNVPKEEVAVDRSGFDLGPWDGAQGSSLTKFNPLKAGSPATFTVTLPDSLPHGMPVIYFGEIAGSNAGAQLTIWAHGPNGAPSLSPRTLMMNARNVGEKMTAQGPGVYSIFVQSDTDTALSLTVAP